MRPCHRSYYSSTPHAKPRAVSCVSEFREMAQKCDSCGKVIVNCRRKSARRRHVRYQSGHIQLQSLHCQNKALSKHEFRFLAKFGQNRRCRIEENAGADLAGLVFEPNGMACTAFRPLGRAPNG